MDYEKVHELYTEFQKMNQLEFEKLLDQAKDKDERVFLTEVWGCILRERQLRIINNKK
ncbi:MAG TPA: hypothetical protein IAC14_14125 [Candidatus Scybalomonas excrementigallinarum]|nr:hypothetical protein [Candidatus Scybalomonas excrementigallinarum]